MFVGHFAVALAAKPVAPRLPLPLLFAAVQFLDILWPAFVVLGVEHARIVPGVTAASPLDLYDYPYSHSLLMSVVWSLAFAAPLFVTRRPRDALVLGGCVFSHFVLDWITHRPDMPLAPGSDVLVGLGLWNSLWGSIVVEGALFAAGITIYARSTRVTGRWGSIGFWALIVVLTGSWLSGPLGPPPPGIMPVVWSVLALIPVILIWAALVERARPIRD